MNQFGKNFRVMIYGESHGSEIGVLIDGCPAGIKIDTKLLNDDLAKRKPGGVGTTKRVETDEPLISSGVLNGVTTGFPVAIRFLNSNINSKDYSEFLNKPRPSHADFSANIKYKGFQDYRGGGPFSGRVAIGLVAAGAIAKQILPFKIDSKLIQVGKKKNNFEEHIKEICDKGDSIGGIVEVTVTNMTPGIGEPFFNSIESVVSHIVFSVPGIKGIEFGIGFTGINLMGSEFNDCIINEKGETKTNNNGGINGGISNGNDIIVRVFIKPTPSIYKDQKTFNFKTNKMDILSIKGRHDACIAKRAKIVIENAVAIALADLFLTSKIAN